MRTGPVIQIAEVALCWWSGDVRAQSAATCEFDAPAAAVTVSVNGNGTKSGHLRAEKTTGEITLDGVPCSGATVFNTDSIQVNGGPLAEEVFSRAPLRPA